MGASINGNKARKKTSRKHSVNGQRIRNLLENQAILLAGGLGSNRYLYNFLDSRFPDLQIIQRPYPQPWSAICRGAVIRADIVAAPPPDLEADFQEAAGPAVGVLSRKSRRSYGIAKFVDFIDGFHELEDRHVMESVNRVVAINQMEWYIKRVRLNAVWHSSHQLKV